MSRRLLAAALIGLIPIGAAVVLTSADARPTTSVAQAAPGPPRGARVARPPRAHETTPDTLRFAGTVHRGETFRHALPGGVEFRLTPMRGVSDGGWDLGIWPADSIPIDFVAVATPPYRGMNPRDIEGWHFRNQANTGPNEGDVNAPQEGREFRFVANRADFDSSYAALQRVMWPYSYADAVVERAATVLDSLATGTGLLTITALSLTPPGVGAQAEIDSMLFEVALVPAHRHGTAAPPRRATN